MSRSMNMKQLIIATKNKGKAKEFSDLFIPYKIQTKTLLDLEQTIDIEETGSTFLENARLKAEQARDQLNCHVLADDSGLVVDALNGEPGIYSARYAGKDATDQKNIDKLMIALKDIPEHKRTARFVAVVALALENGETIYRKGICEGKIAFHQDSDYVVGYDNRIIHEGYNHKKKRSDPTNKNKIRQRSQDSTQREQ